MSAASVNPLFTSDFMHPKAVLDWVDHADPSVYFASKDVSKKFVPFLQLLCLNIRIRVLFCGDPLPEFTTVNSVNRDCLFLTLLWSFLTEVRMEIAVCDNNDIDTCSDSKLSDLEYAVDITHLT